MTEPLEISVSVKLPKSLHEKLTKIAKAEGKPLNAVVGEAIRAHAAGYQRVTTTVVGYARKKAK